MIDYHTGDTPAAPNGPNALLSQLLGYQPQGGTATAAATAAPAAPQLMDGVEEGTNNIQAQVISLKQLPSHIGRYYIFSASLITADSDDGASGAARTTPRDGPDGRPAEHPGT